MPELRNDFQSRAITERTGTFTDNMKLPIHRWFRYFAEFSATWVQGVIAELKPKFEVLVDYNNSDTIRATFQSKNLLIDFLKKLEH
jgi:hypothetical protein